MTKTSDEKDKATMADLPPALAAYYGEEAEDKKRMRKCLAVALVLHLGLFFVTFPKAESEPLQTREAQRVYVVEQVRFKPPPPPDVQQEIPQRRARQVPVPDPTPDEPEPIREVQMIEEPEIDLSDIDVVTRIPDGPPEPPSDPGPLVVGGDVLAPVKVSGPDPVYTETARRARISGVVILEAVVDAQGNVTEVRVLKGLPMGLTENALAAFNQWKFNPGTLHDKPVPVRYNLSIYFGLN